MSGVSFKVVIPARYGSTRLPGKPLLPLAGKPMLQHVYERAAQSGADEVVIATDDQRIESTAQDFGAVACMTATSHTSGTERIAEVAAKFGWADDCIVVNVQGDEPLLPPALVTQVAAGLAQHADARVATLACPLTDRQEWQDPNVVKAVLDRDGYALYFSRAAIPFDRDGDADARQTALRHLGLYAYRVDFLKAYSTLEPSPLERIEKLEQLRVLWHGMRIHVGIARERPGPGVDTQADFERVAAMLDG
ncbi:MAG: 3-deoxy-manno-octulosonate cytidylyltransferase [Gammaproteobacteria bacterium]